MKIKCFNSISLHLGIFLLFLWIDFTLRRCIFEKRAKCIRVRSSLGKQRLRSRGKIHSNSGERCEKEGAVACVSSSRWQFRDGTKYDHEKSIFFMALFRDAIGDDDSGGSSSDSRQRVTIFACLSELSKYPIRTFHQNSSSYENKSEFLKRSK